MTGYHSHHTKPKRNLNPIILQGPRIVWRLEWGVENSDSKCAVRVENSVLKYAYNVESSI